MNEKIDFLADNVQGTVAQNKALSHHLKGVWRDYNIVSIRRIVIGSTSGWEVTYRD